MKWPLQERQDRLNQVVAEALRVGPQVITANGEETAVVLSMDEYRRLQPPADNLADFLMRSPLRGSGICIERENAASQADRAVADKRP